jgi:WD40 repeat protein/tRNA A-37 threonylcarbamoyl transferase component Bud32
VTLAANTLINNRYQIIRPVGQGGMGAVYEAVDTHLETTIALKQRRIGHSASQKETDYLTQAFEREAKILAKLRHLSLPKVMDYFSTTEGQFLVMEFFAGKDLCELQEEQQHAPFAVNEVLDWAEHILDALHYLHSQQPAVIHRDITPHNLKKIDTGEIVLLDFGMAKTPTAVQQQDNMSIPFGKIEYAPLEQIQGTGTEERSDLYAFAATIYHLLTGKPPKDALTRITTTTNGSPDPLLPVHKVNDRVPPAVGQVIQQAMALKMDKRPHSASAMRDSLHIARQPSSGWVGGRQRTGAQPVVGSSAKSGSSGTSGTSGSMPTVGAAKEHPAPQPSQGTQQPHTHPTVAHTIPNTQQSSGVPPTQPASSSPSPSTQPSTTSTKTRSRTLPFKVNPVEVASQLPPWVWGGVATTFVVLILIIAFMGRNGEPSSVASIPTATSTLVSVSARTDTPTQTPSPTITPTPAPTPEGVINAANIIQLEQQAVWEETKEEDVVNVPAVDFSPDGTMIASGSWDHSVKLWRVSDGMLLHKLKDHASNIENVAFSPDGTMVASASWDKTVKLWNVRDGSLIRTLEGHDREVYQVDFSPDGTMVASGSLDYTVKLWNVRTGELIRTLDDHEDNAWAIDFSPDGTVLASGSADETVKLWNVRDGSLIRTISGHPDKVYAVAISPDGQTLASATGTEIRLWNMKDGTPIRTMDAHKPWVGSLDFAPNGETLVSGGADWKVRVWDVATGDLLRTLGEHKNYVLSVVYSPDGQMIASSGGDKTIRLWSIAGE